MTQTLGRISFTPLFNRTVGFENIFDEIDKYLNSTQETRESSSSFPPHNIRRVAENRYIVEMAVAGFKKDEIEISVKENILTIKGSKKNSETVGEYLYKGIGTRSFIKTISIAETVEIRGANFVDGILSIGLENIIPENKKTRMVKITDNFSFSDKKLLNE